MEGDDVVVAVVSAVVEDLLFGARMLKIRNRCLLLPKQLKTILNDAMIVILLMTPGRKLIVFFCGKK